MTQNDLKVGIILCANDDHYMTNNGTQILIKDKSYIILKLYTTDFSITSELDIEHEFTYDKMNNYFYIKNSNINNNLFFSYSDKNLIL